MNPTKNQIKKYSLVATLVIVFLVALIASTSLVEEVPADHIVINQVPVTGTLDFWVEPGLYGQWLGSTTPYKKSFQHWFTADSEKGSGTNQAQKIIFNDAGIGWLSGSVRIQLPRDEKRLRLIQEDFGSMEAVQKELVQETIDKVIFATGPLMSSYESYAVKKNDLINFIEDQLKNGIYKTVIREETKEDPLTGEKKTVRIAERIASDTVEDFGWKRQEIAPFFEYGLKVATVSVDDIEYEERIILQIQEQQNARMQVQTAIAEAQEAEQNAKKAEAVGRQKAAEARATQEVEKVKAVVDAERRREVAELAKEEAEFYKQKKLLQAEADAEYKRKVMQADGALAQKLETYKEVNFRYAEAIQNYKGNWVPNMVMGASEGSAGSGGTTAVMQYLNLMMAKTAQDLNLDLKVKQ